MGLLFAGKWAFYEGLEAVLRNRRFGTGCPLRALPLTTTHDPACAVDRRHATGATSNPYGHR